MRLILALILMAAAAAEPASDARLPHQFLKAHNDVRAAVGLAPIGWSDKLAAFAREWATTLVVRSEFRHSHHPGYGENMFEIRGGKSSPEEVVDAWAEERKDYDYRLNRCLAGRCGHYTQIVWKGTTTIGCAVARSSFREVWVCEYEPPGNYVGQRPY